MRAVPTGRRAVLLLAVALAALAVVLATAHSHTRAATARSQELPGLWALEVTPEFAPLVRARLLALAKKRGLNTLVLNRHLSDEQKRRVRSVARRFGLRAVQLRRRACEREVTLCAVVARTAVAVEQLSRSRYVDIVVLRLRGPKPVPRLTERYVRAASGTASARLLLLPTLRPRLRPCVLAQGNLGRRRRPIRRPRREAERPVEQARRRTLPRRAASAAWGGCVPR